MRQGYRILVTVRAALGKCPASFGPAAAGFLAEGYVMQLYIFLVADEMI